MAASTINPTLSGGSSLSSNAQYLGSAAPAADRRGEASQPLLSLDFEDSFDEVNQEIGWVASHALSQSSTRVGVQLGSRLNPNGSSEDLAPAGGDANIPSTVHNQGFGFAYPGQQHPSYYPTPVDGPVLPQYYYACGQDGQRTHFPFTEHSTAAPNAVEEHIGRTDQLPTQYVHHRTRRSTPDHESRYMDRVEDERNTDGAVILPKLRPHPRQQHTGQPPMNIRSTAKVGRKFQCKVEDCRSKGKDGSATCFRSKHDLRRHFKDVHRTNLDDGRPITLYSCPWEDCPRRAEGFPRSQNLNAHVTKKHHGRWPSAMSSGTPVLLASHEIRAGPSVAPTSAVPLQLDPIGHDQEGRNEPPALLTNAERSNEDISCLFRIVQALWDYRWNKQNTLAKLDSQIQAMRPEYDELEAENRKLKDWEEVLQQLVAKRTGTDAEAFYREDMSELRQRNKEAAIKWAKVNSEFNALQVSRGEVLSELAEIKERAECYDKQLRAKRSDHDVLVGADGDYGPDFTGSTASIPPL